MRDYINCHQSQSGFSFRVDAPQADLKKRRQAIKNLTTVTSHQHVFLKDMDGQPTHSQRGEAEAAAKYSTAAYASQRAPFKRL